MDFKERYKYNSKTDLLGKGGFAKVYKANDTLIGRDVAIKVFNSTEGGNYTVLEEIKKVIRLEHPNLLRYYDVAILKNTNALGESEIIQVGIMELANAGDLKTFAKENPNSSLLYDLLRQVLNGLGFLHSKGIIHRDLKPQNILLIDEDGVLTAKIADFGISKKMDANSNSASLPIGTIEYMAPEQFNPSKYGIGGKISTNVDLWSFGVLVHELVTNDLPFGQRNGDTTAEQIMNTILSADLPEEISNIKEPYQAIIRKCLIADAKQRIKNAYEIISYLENNQLPPDGPRDPKVPPAPPREKGGDSLDTILMPPPFDTEEGDGKTTPLGGINEEGKTKPDKEKKPPEIDKPKPEKKSYKNIIIGALISVTVLVAILLGFKFFPETIPVQPDFYTTIEAQLKNKQYEEILSSLKDSVNLQTDSTDFTSKSAIKYYTTALLAKGDTVTAIPYIVRSFNLGINEHAYTLGELYFKGSKANKIEPSVVTAKPLFEAAQNDPRAETMLGNIYFEGLGKDSINYNLAISYYKSAANKGDNVAMYSLGLAYLNGLGVEQSNLEAKKWFEKVILKNVNSEVRLAAKKGLGQTVLLDEIRHTLNEEDHSQSVDIKQNRTFQYNNFLQDYEISELASYGETNAYDAKKRLISEKELKQKWGSLYNLSKIPADSPFFDGNDPGYLGKVDFKTIFSDTNQLTLRVSIFGRTKNTLIAKRKVFLIAVDGKFLINDIQQF